MRFTCGEMTLTGNGRANALFAEALIRSDGDARRDAYPTVGASTADETATAATVGSFCLVAARIKSLELSLGNACSRS